MKPKNLLKSGFIVFLACTLIRYTLEFLLEHPIAFILVIFIEINTFKQKNQ
ncbi:hypothetical protein IGI96_001721 [Enterococcus sp. DIV0421]